MNIMFEQHNIIVKYPFLFLCFWGWLGTVAFLLVAGILRVYQWAIASLGKDQKLKP